MFRFLNFLLSFFIFKELVNKIVKVIFLSLKNLIIFEIFFNFFVPRFTIYLNINPYHWYAFDKLLQFLLPMDVSSHLGGQNL